MSNTHIMDEHGYEYEGDLLDLIEQDPEAIEGNVMDEEDTIVSVVFTIQELKQLGAFLEAVLHVNPYLGDMSPQIIQQVIDFAREARFPTDIPMAGE